MYQVIYADPPWDYAGKTQHTAKTGVMSAINHYPTMKLAELKKLSVPKVCDKNCVLFMWTSSPHLAQAIELMGAWGFDYKTVAFVWDKEKTNPGHYTLSQCELVIVGKRGIFPERGSRKERQYFKQLRGRHSEKPTEFRQRIERMFPTAKKLEMFARTKTDGWDVFGNEVDGSIKLD